MTREQAQSMHSDWLWTYRQLQDYTDGFTMPFAGKSNEWFIHGPAVSKAWVKNAAWAKCLIPRKYHYAVTPGIVYATEFSRIQNAVMDNLQPDVDFCWKLCQLANTELEKMKQ